MFLPPSLSLSSAFSPFLSLSRAFSLSLSLSRAFFSLFLRSRALFSLFLRFRALFSLFLRSRVISLSFSLRLSPSLTHTHSIAHIQTNKPSTTTHFLSPSGSWAAGTEYISRLAPPGMKSTAQSLFSAAYAGVGAGAGALVSGSLYTTHGSDACFQGTAAAVVAAWLGLSALESVVSGAGEEEQKGTGTEEKKKMEEVLFLDGDNSSSPPPRGARAPRPCCALGAEKQEQQQQYQQQRQRPTSGGSPARLLGASPGSPPRSPASKKRL